MRESAPQLLYDGGVKTPRTMTSFRHVILMVDITVGAAGVIKLRASAHERMPDFSLAASRSNFHAPVMSKNLNDNTIYSGSTGFSCAAAGQYFLEVNTNMISWLAVDDSAAAGATFSVYVVGSNDDA